MPEHQHSTRSSTQTVHDPESPPEGNNWSEEAAQSLDKEVEKDSVTQDVLKDVAAVGEAIEDPDKQFGEHPDGGLKAWLVVIGCAASACATFGLINAWGVFQAYYTRSILAGTSPSTIAWIGSVQYALVFLPGLFVGRIFDMGYTKLPLGIASLVVVATTFLTAQCKVYWQFLLCQGIALGFACGVVFGTVMGCPAHWFKRKLGFALGIMALGSSLGGTLYPIAVRNLMERVGFQWTMRILGFIEIVLLTFQLVTVERRLPPKKHSGPFISLDAFKSPPFTLYSLASFTAFLGIYTVLTYIDVSAVSEGIPDDIAFYLLAIANACSAVGRVIGGLAADYTGPLNVMTPATFIAGVMTYVWPFATGTGGNVAVAVVYGASSGVYVSLLAAPIVRMGHTQDVGVRVGMSMTLIALGAVAGPPISGALNAATGSFKFTGVYAGTAVMVACVLMMATRYALLGRFWGKC